MIKFTTANNLLSLPFFSVRVDYYQQDVNYIPHHCSQLWIGEFYSRITSYCNSCSCILYLTKVKNSYFIMNIYSIVKGTNVIKCPTRASLN